MKTLKIAAIATIVTIILILTCAVAMAGNPSDEFYCRLVLVTSYEDLQDARLVSCEDRYGMIWQFYDDEYTWTVNDYGVIQMWICTDDPYDDEVMDAMLLGHTDKPEYFWHYSIPRK